MIRVTAVAALLILAGVGCSKEQPATNASAQPATPAKSVVQTPVEALPMAPDEVIATDEGSLGGGADEAIAFAPEDTELLSDDDLAAMDDAAGKVADNVTGEVAGLKNQVTESDLAAIDAAEAAAEMDGMAADTRSPVAVLEQDAALQLAQKSGCLACHAIDHKVVGPAWADVAERYRGADGVREKLIKKVKTGGKGNWTDVTKGIPMPPYSPRVADADIAQLVDFVLSLAIE